MSLTPSEMDALPTQDKEWEDAQKPVPKGVSKYDDKLSSLELTKAEERAVGGVQGSPDWFEWTQTAELPPAPPVYPSLHPSAPVCTRLHRLPVSPIF